MCGPDDVRARSVERGAGTPTGPKGDTTHLLHDGNAWYTTAMALRTEAKKAEPNRLSNEATEEVPVSENVMSTRSADGSAEALPGKRERIANQVARRVRRSATRYAENVNESE